MSPRRYCIWGEPVDCLGDHFLSYPRVSYGEPTLDRYLESHLPVVRPAAADDDDDDDDKDPWRAHDSTHPFPGSLQSCWSTLQLH